MPSLDASEDPPRWNRSMRHKTHNQATCPIPPDRGPWDSFRPRGQPSTMQITRQKWRWIAQETGLMHGTAAPKAKSSATRARAGEGSTPTSLTASNQARSPAQQWPPKHPSGLLQGNTSERTTNTQTVWPLLHSIIVIDECRAKRLLKCHLYSPKPLILLSTLAAPALPLCMLLAI